VPYNSAGIHYLADKYQDESTLIVNQGRRNRLPECISTITEFVNADIPEFKKFGPSGHQMPVPPTPSPEALPDEEEKKSKRKRR